MSSAKERLVEELDKLIECSRWECAKNILDGKEAKYSKVIAARVADFIIKRDRKNFAPLIKTKEYWIAKGDWPANSSEKAINQTLKNLSIGENK